MKLFLFAIGIQIVIICLLFLKIQQKNNILGVSLNSIRSNTIKFAPTKELKFFYEPHPNTVVEEANEWLSYTPKYTINKDSLNERFNYETQKRKGVFRIVVLGDSFTFGANVNTVDNWTEVLEDRLNNKYICPQINKFEILNLGVSGYDTAYEVERYNIRGKKYDPDLVIMLVVEFMRMADYRNEHRPYNGAEVAEMRAKAINVPGDSEDTKLKDEIRMSYQYPYYDKLFSLYSGTVLIVDHEKNEKANNFFKTLRERYPQLLYTQTAFPMGDMQTSLFDGHPNKEGHAKIAEYIFKYLTKNNTVGCKY